MTEQHDQAHGDSSAPSPDAATAPTVAPTAHTPGPWVCGYWGGQCHVASHVAARHHPGPPACVYDPVFHPMIAGVVVAISTAGGVEVVGTKDDALKIHPADARLITAAPDLLAALKALLIMTDREQPRKLDESLAWRQNDDLARSLATAAIAKAEGR